MGYCFIDPVRGRPSISIPPKDDLSRDGYTIDDLAALRTAPPLGFPRRAWAPDIMGLAVAAEFMMQPWGNQIHLDPPPAVGSAAAMAEIAELLDLAKTERPARLTEILEQDGAYHEYLFRMVMMTDQSHPHTYELVKVGARVSEMLMAYYKLVFNRPRPQQIAPALFPPVGAAPHPAYPSGHATTARLAALCLCDVVPAALAGAVMWMSDRIARNREVAGVHYRSDTVAGQSLAQQAHDIMLQGARYIALRNLARAEWQP
jgi:acid phosphatase (class A)